MKALILRREIPGTSRLHSSRQVFKLAFPAINNLTLIPEIPKDGITSNKVHAYYNTGFDAERLCYDTKLIGETDVPDAIVQQAQALAEAQIALNQHTAELARLTQQTSDEINLG